MLHVDGREFIIVGTAHISRESADLVREVIENERPDCVCVELDAQRFEALSHRRKFEELDLKQLIRKKQLAALRQNASSSASAATMAYPRVVRKLAVVTSMVTWFDRSIESEVSRSRISRSMGTPSIRAEM